MLKSKKKELYKKLTIHSGKKLSQLEAEGWSARELFERTGIPQNRQTEIRNYERYDRTISELNFAKLVTEGIVTIDELIKRVALDAEEKEYIMGFKFYEDKEAMKYYVKASELGLDAAEILKKAVNKASH